MCLPYLVIAQYSSVWYSVCLEGGEGGGCCLPCVSLAICGNSFGMYFLDYHFILFTFRKPLLMKNKHDMTKHKGTDRNQGAHLIRVALSCLTRSLSLWATSLSRWASSRSPCRACTRSSASRLPDSASPCCLRSCCTDDWAESRRPRISCYGEHEVREGALRSERWHPHETMRYMVFHS